MTSEIENEHERGFTLIELLVVIAIIGVLSSVILSSLNVARAKGRDARRISDLRQMKIALELYYQSNGSYPSSLGTWRGECNAHGGLTPNNVIPGLVPTYMTSFPSDPTMNKTANTSCYVYYSDAIDYAFIDQFIQDVGFTYTSQPSLLDPARDGGTNICTLDATNYFSRKIYTPGAVCW